VNCKPGDLVILLSAANAAMKKYVGTIRTVKCACMVHKNSWDLEPPVIGQNGLEASWSDDTMRPIRDQDGTDEMIRIAGLPHKETA
jgi:hypothetical protein